MNEIIESKIDELYNILMEKPMKILEIFNDFFGEERVDMQGFIDVKEFKFWLSTTRISNYIPRVTLNASIRDWDIYSSKSITELNGEILDKVLSVLCQNNIVEDIRSKKFNLGFIIVHFPFVRVTNEFDKFVDINHLYAKVIFNSKGVGEGYFGLNRAEYSFLHISNNYMHSHVSSIPFNDFTAFQTPCTGSGPINNTLSHLARKFNEELWQLLCLELDKYVQVESIAGVPYHRLENLGTSNTTTQAERFEIINKLYYYNGCFDVQMAKKFITHLIHSKKLKYNYNSNSYSIGMSFTEFIITISNEFIKWYNREFNKKTYSYTLDRLLSSRVLIKCIISGNKIFFEKNNISVESYMSYVGKKICTFKGQDVLISINDLKDVDESNKSIALNPKIALYLLTRILNVLNYRYGRSEQRNQEDIRTSEKVRYI